MDTGLQWDTRVYPNPRNGKKWLRTIICTLAAPCLTFMIMLAPAHAAIDSVAAVYDTWSNGWYGGSKSAYDACQGYVLRMQVNYHFIDPVPSTNIHAPLGAMDCLTSNGNIIDVIGVAWPEYYCPTPVDYFTILYSFSVDASYRFTGKCERTVPDTCQIPGLTADPADPNGLEAFIKQYADKEDGVLTRELERTLGRNGYSLLSTKTQQAERCLANLIGSELSQADSGYAVSSTVRTLAYQAHLRAVWDKYNDLKKAKPAIQKMCPALIAQVEGEMGFRLNQDPTDSKIKCNPAGHCLRARPAKDNPRHTQNTAFDIASAAVEAYVHKYVIDTKRNMATAANACNLTWGGTFKGKGYDPVHFLCCVK